MYSGTLTQLKSSHKNLRTPVTEGEYFNIPSVGKRFLLYGKSLTDEKATRVIATSGIREVRYLENGWEFDTEFSTYTLSENISEPVAHAEPETEAELLDALFGGPPSQFEHTTCGGVLFTLGDTVRSKRNGREGQLKSLYLGGMDDVIAHVVPQDLKPDAADPHADCQFCQSWAEPISQFEIV